MSGSEENHTGEKLGGKLKEGIGNLTGNDKLKAEVRPTRPRRRPSRASTT